MAGDPLADKFYYEVEYPVKTALVIGNEGRGFTAVNPAEADLRVKIPLTSGAESLNAAVAAGVLVYEITRPIRLSCGKRL